MKFKTKILKGIYKRITGAMSGLGNVGVNLHSDAMPCFIPDENCIYMPFEVSYAKDEDESFQLGRGVLIHEVSHVMFAPDCSKLIDHWNENYPPELVKDFAEIINIILDANNEYKVAELFPQLRSHLANKTNRLFENSPKLRKDENPFLQILMRIDEVGDCKPEWPDNYQPELRKFVEDVVSEYKKGNINSADDKELIKFIKQTVRKWKKVKGAQKQRPSQVNKLMERLADAITKGDEEKQAALQKKLNGLNKNIEFNGIPQEISRTAPTKPDNLSGKSLEELQELLKQANDKIKTQAKGNHATSPITEDVVDIDVNEMDEPPYNTDLRQAAEMGKRLNRILRQQIMLEEDFEKRHRNGDLDIEEVRKQVSQNGRITKETIFQRKFDYRRGGRWAVSVLVDISGSMGGNKMEQARKMMTILIYGLKGLHNAASEIVAFDCQSDTEQYFVKSFKQKSIKPSLVNRLEAGGGTPTGIVMQNAISRLCKRPEEKRLLVVITDGMPYNKEHVSLMSKEAVRLGISVIGIGIGIEEELLQEMYPVVLTFDENNRKLYKEVATTIIELLHKKSNKKLIRPTWER